MVRRKNVKRFTVELSPEEYELLEFLCNELNVRKAEVVRTALRRYFAELVTTYYAEDLKVFLDFVRSRLKESKQ